MIILERTGRTTSGSDDQTSSEPNGDGADAYLEFRGKRHPDSSYSVRYRTDDRCVFVRGAGWWLYASTPTGLAIFTALNELLAQAPSRPLAAVLDSLEDMRPAAFVAFDEAAETLHFGRSLDGFASLYCGSTGEHLVIADSALNVATRLGPVRLSRHDEEVWCARNVLEPEGSFYEGVKRCFAGVRYDAAPNEREPRIARLMAPTTWPSKIPDPGEMLACGLRALFASYGRRKIALLLSGGVDSRTLLVGIMDAVRAGILQRDQVLCTSVAFPGFRCDESDLIRQIIDESGFAWERIDATRDTARQASDATLDLSAPPFPTSFMGIFCMQAAQRWGAEVVLSGNGGDELLDFNLLDVLGMPWWARLRRLGLVRALRGANGWLDDAKSLAVVVLGRYGQRHAANAISRLPRGSINTFRIGMRLNLAGTYGYETAAETAARFGMLFDAPFFRGPFLAKWDPMTGVHGRNHLFKAAAHAYMRAVAPTIEAVPTRKVTFDEAVSHYFKTSTTMCDEIDGYCRRQYSSAGRYNAWVSRQARCAPTGKWGES